MFERAKIPIFERIGLEYQCFKGERRNTSVSKDRAGIPVFERIVSEYQCLKE